MFEAVLFDLQHVVEGSVQLLYGHLDGTLQENGADPREVRPNKLSLVLFFHT